VELQKQALLSDLIVMANADAIVTDSEYEFILRLADRMGFSKNELDALFENPQPSRPLFSELERITHFYRLVLVMHVDGEVHEAERVAIHSFGLKMGIRKGVIDQIIHKMEASNNKTLPTKTLVKIFNTYYN